MCVKQRHYAKYPVNTAYAEWEKRHGAVQPQLTQQKALQQQHIDQESMAVITNLEDLASYDQLSSEKHNLAGIPLPLSNSSC